MKPTDETPNITPDEPLDDTATPLPGVQPDSDEISEGSDTVAVPGQPQKPEEVGGI